MNNARRDSGGTPVAGCSRRLSRFRSSTATLQGSIISVQKEYGGLGIRYYDKLGEDLDKILQVDIVKSKTETKGSVRGRGIKLALEMHDRGIVEKDIIVICSRNDADQTIVVLATLFLGAIVAPLNPDFNYNECMELIKQLKPKMCFTDSRSLSQIDRILHDLGHNPTDVVCFSQECLDTTPFSKLLNHKEDEHFRPIFVEDPKKSVAFILPTQGTTGDPKLICLSHHNILLQTMIFVDIFGSPETVLSFFPLSWFLQTILTCVCFEYSTTRILPGTFSERNACKIIHDFKIGHAIFGTEYAVRVANDVGIADYNLNCLKCVMIGTVNTTKYDLITVRRLLPHVKFLLCYCSTETGCIAATKIKNYPASLEKPNSVGPLSLNCRIKIFDIVTKDPLTANAYGELYYHGDGLMLGYFKDTEKTLAAIERGFFKTGDMAMYDDDGWLYIRGRIEDLITMDTFQLCPLDLEDVILTHPYVKDVCVIGNDKEIVAIVKKFPDKELSMERIQKFINERTPEKYRPTKIFFLDSFPRTSIGNIKKRVLRDEYLGIKLEYISSIASILTSNTH